MPLTITDFAGFEPEMARRYVAKFVPGIQSRGELYFKSGAVCTLKCNVPGRNYSVKVQGDFTYDVELHFEDKWAAECTCPVGIECKHIYAAVQKMLALYDGLMANGSGKRAGMNAPAPAPAPEIPAVGLAAAVREKLGRKLERDEIRYLKNLNHLFHRALAGGLHFKHELEGLDLPASTDYWGALELYPKVPREEVEFWNYLALYLTEKVGRRIPEFMEPVTDLTAVRAAMQKHYRAREVQRWNQMLSQYAHEGLPAQPATADGPAPEMRLRFQRRGVAFEWRLAGDPGWTEIKPRKAAHFEASHGAKLSPAAGLLWLSYLQRSQSYGATDLDYDDPWVIEQVGRWIRQPLLRPLLVDETGGPLAFHEAPLRWQVGPPADADGDYTFSLVQADGGAVPEILLAAKGHPPVYLTAAGVFYGPPFEPCVMADGKAMPVPAKALETAAGLRLLERLRVAPPPRLAARIRTVKLHPSVRAEIKVPWTGAAREYCEVQVLGASADGEVVEYWTGHGWLAGGQPGRPQRDGFVQVDRTDLGGLISPLEQAGFKWDYNLKRWQVRVSKKFAGTFMTFLQALPAGTNIELGGELASFQGASVAGKIRLEATEGELDWFDLRVLVDVNDATLTPAEIKLLLDAGGDWVRLDGKGWRKLEFALSEEEDRELARLGLTPHALSSEPQRLHAFQLADKAARKFLPEDTCNRIERRAAELQARVTPPVPAQIRGELRSYQLEGFHFLAYLSTNRFGGILADDMGLGKTLQALAWLGWLRAAAPAPDQKPFRPSLVVCPKSVADNWRAEAAKFFPDLKVRVWSAGELKASAGDFSGADLHVLNYSQLRLAAKDFTHEHFQAVILDEGQYIKNPSSLTAQVARKLRAEHRLVLSGTPIENRLLDLWSLMQFAMPGALGSRAEFNRLYDAKNDPFARQRLSARVRPFLIRRTKGQVAQDLPDRVEEDLYCELEGEQKALYRAELKRAQTMLLGVKTAAALNQQRFNVLTSLLRLRQICCHPKLINPDSKATSAKMEALIETLEPLLEQGEKVLVFSQFVGLLDLLRAEVKARDWKHWYLAGDTENRGDLVRDFQAAEGAGVFLISLKAGGFGLNLTAASYVVLFDPWWNPAVENQAIDRTHRIGQDRKVMAYRLLIKDSVEEKIRTLQRQKSSLAADVFGEDKFSQSLSLEDLRFLLAG
jgi:hypothetical protein